MLKHIKPILIALLQMPLTPLALPLTAIAYCFAKWDSEPTLDSNGTTPYVRGDLPKWASWLSTPDERLPGGTYEPTVLSILKKYGRAAASIYWLGIRNTWYGLAFKFAIPMKQRWPLEPGYYEDKESGLWWLRKPILGGKFQLKAGYRSYQTPHGIVGVPCLTITKP